MAPRSPKADGEAQASTRSPTAVDRAVGKRIRLLRRNAGLTLRGLGDAIGVSAVQLQRYETGASRVAASRLIAIADALGASTESLLAAPKDIDAAANTFTRSRDVVELVRIFSDIQHPAHRLAILAFIRAMAPTFDAPPAGGAPFASGLPGGLNGTIPADKS